MQIFKKLFKPKLYNFKTTQFTESRESKAFNFDKHLYNSVTLTKLFDIFTKSKNYRDNHRYIIIAITTPVLLSSGALMVGDFINMTFHPYTIKTNINSINMISLFIKGTMFKHLVDNNFDSNIPPLLLSGTSSIVFGYFITSVALGPVALTVAYMAFLYHVLHPYKLNRIWTVEMAMLWLAVLFLFVSTMRNYQKWRETLVNEKHFKKAVELHMLSSDKEFAKDMDEYVKYLQQYDINFFNKKG
jgi:hypothetical protein